jgi:isobutyryl-CoA mutase
MRRILQSTGCEVVHLGHNRSVKEVVDAALQEDAHGIAMSSYQGGHVEYFKYMIDMLREAGAEHIKVFGGGGGVIVPAEIRELHDYGVTRIFSPEDGAKLGLQGMINEIVSACDYDLSAIPAAQNRSVALARQITQIEIGAFPAAQLQALRDAAKAIATPTLGITGTGGDSALSHRSKRCAQNRGDLD